MSGPVWPGAVTAFGVTAVVMLPLVACLRRLDILDRPNERSSHQRAVPRGGGLSPAVGVVVGLVVLSLAGVTSGDRLVGAVVIAVGFGAIGLADDLAGLGPRIRLGLQTLVALLGLAVLVRGMSGPVAWMVVFSVGVALWLVAYVNAFNFMDGINGVSAAQVLVAGATWWAIGATRHVAPLAAGGAIALGAGAGFLPFNAPRAFVFLGDVGSYLFGGLLGALAVVGLRGGLAPEAILAPLGVYLADTATTIVRRVKAGETWYKAHRSHAYQRLTQLGWSHMAATATVGLTMALTSALGAVSLSGDVAARGAADAGIVVVLVAYLASPSLLARSRHGSAVAGP